MSSITETSSLHTNRKRTKKTTVKNNDNPETSVKTRKKSSAKASTSSKDKSGTLTGSHGTNRIVTLAEPSQNLSTPLSNEPPVTTYSVPLSNVMQADTKKTVPEESNAADEFLSGMISEANSILDEAVYDNENVYSDNVVHNVNQQPNFTMFTQPVAQPSFYDQSISNSTNGQYNSTLNQTTYQYNQDSSLNTNQGIYQGEQIQPNATSYNVSFASTWHNSLHPDPSQKNTYLTTNKDQAITVDAYSIKNKTPNSNLKNTTPTPYAKQKEILEFIKDRIKQLEGNKELFEREQRIAIAYMNLAAKFTEMSKAQYDMNEARISTINENLAEYVESLKKQNNLLTTLANDTASDSSDKNIKKTEEF